MHIDEGKKFDKRNIEKNIKSGIISGKDYEAFLAKLPDVSDKLFSPEEAANESEELEAAEGDAVPQKKALKKKVKGKTK